jgi:hypothetical protein
MVLILGWNRKTSRATVCDEAPGFSARVLSWSQQFNLPGKAAGSFLCKNLSN